jgi:hypothetical protein
MSVLIYNGFFTPEVCVSPSETDPRIQVFKSYVYNNPPAAVTPAQALWDPAFRGTPDAPPVNGVGAGQPGNLSYAMMPAAGARRSMFSNTFQASEAVIGNRGPAYVAKGSGAGLSWQLAPARAAGATPDTPFGAGSSSLGIHGTPTAWKGFVSYNDNHVSFESDCRATPFTFSGLPKGCRSQLDNLFVNEDDATRAACSETLEGAAGKNMNNFLRLWTGGKQREHDQGWWDAWKRGESSYRDGALASITPWYD